MTETTVRSGIRWEKGDDILKPPAASGFHPWPFEPTLPVAIRFVSLGSRVAVPLMRHDYFEVCFLRRGCITKQVQDRFFKMEEGDVFVIGSTYYHRISHFFTPRAREILLYFRPNIVLGTEPSAEASEYLAPFLYPHATFPYVIPSKTGIPSEIYKLVMRIHTELPGRSVRARAYVKAYLRTILVLVGDYYRSNYDLDPAPTDRERGIGRLKPLFDYMDLHSAEPLSIDEAAAIVRMSRSHFMRFFRRITGESFINYLNRFRSAKAEILLVSTDKTIAEIAQEVGFCDQSYFSKIFHKFVQTQPREYRQRLQR